MGQDSPTESVVTVDSIVICEITTEKRKMILKSVFV